MTLRWFVEEIGGLTILTRLDNATEAAVFTSDGGATWTTGDRTRRMRGATEITETEALVILDRPPPDDPPRAEPFVVPDIEDWTPEQLAKLRRIATEPDPNDN